MSQSDLLKTFWELNRGGVDEKGVAIPHAVSRKGEALTAYAMAMYGPNGPIDTWKFIARILVAEKPDELVFALDRYAKPGQGIRTGDFLSVAHWDGHAWRFGVIAYQYEPPIFDLIDWENAQWSQMLADEMTRVWGQIVPAPGREPSPAMSLPLKVHRFLVPEGRS